MKKIILLTGSLLLLSIACGKTELKQKVQSKVTFVLGKVQVSNSVSAKSKQAVVGMVLEEGDEIQTSKKGKAEILLGSKGFFKLAGNTTFRLDKVALDDSGVNSMEGSIINGRLLSIIKKSKQSETVNLNTPTSLAGVRGTSFVTTVESGFKSIMPSQILSNINEKLKSSISVLNGSVQVNEKSGKGETILEAGKHLSYLSNQVDKKNVQSLKSADLKQLKSILDVSSADLLNINEMVEEIQLSLQAILQYGLNTGKAAIVNKINQLKNKNIIIAPNSGGKIKSSGDQLDKDTNQDDLKLKKDLF